MSFDFTSDSGPVIKEFANCDVLVGIDSIRGIFDEPAKAVNTFDLSVGSTAPRVTVEMASVLDLGIDSGGVITIRRNKTGESTDYLVAGPPEHDGAGLAVITLTEA